MARTKDIVISAAQSLIAFSPLRSASVSMRLVKSFLVLVGLMIAGPARAEELSGIKGLIVDVDGNPLSAFVHVLRVDRDVNPNTTPRPFALLSGEMHLSSPEGSFVFSGLQSGLYIVIVTGEQHGLWERMFLLPPGQTALLDIKLQPMAEATPTPLVAYEAPTSHDLEAYDDILSRFNEPPFCSPSIISSPLESYRLLTQESLGATFMIHVSYAVDRTVTAVFKTLGFDDERYENVPLETLLEGGPEVWAEKLTVWERSMSELGVDDYFTDMLRDFRKEADEFWALPFAVDIGAGLYTDGTTWTVEGVRDGRCHVARRRDYEVWDLKPFVETFSRIAEADSHRAEFQSTLEAAQQGDLEKQLEVSWMYAKGRGVPKNEIEAFRWLQPAAKQGHSYAQYLLAKRYETGLGVTKDQRLAYAWFDVAIAKGHYDDTAFQNLARTLKPDALAEAKELARDLRKTYGISP